LFPGPVGPPTLTFALSNVEHTTISTREDAAQLGQLSVSGIGKIPQFRSVRSDSSPRICGIISAASPDREEAIEKNRRLTNIEPWPKSALDKAYRKVGKECDVIEELATRAQGKPDFSD